ncbi:MAG: hypothetical protein AAGD43_03885 [Pseudomonadota bacterium]
MSIWRKHKVGLLAGLAALIATLLGGCMQFYKTSLLKDNGPPCSITTGGYHLPLSLLELTVVLDKSTQPAHRYLLTINKTLKKVADRNHLYCLDYLANPFAEDHLGIDRTDDGLLRRVFTRAIDKSKDIAIKVIEGIGEAVAGSSAFGRNATPRIQGEAGVVAIYEVDPFNYAAMREVNISLREFGYCIYLDPRADKYVEPWSARQCGVKYLEYEHNIRYSKKGGYNRSHKDSDTSNVYVRQPDRRKHDTPEYEASRTGILYRPNLTHSLVVLRRDDPTSYDPWILDTKRRIEMPNAAPIFSVRVERSLFVERKTDLLFDHGVLENVAINKKSELEAFMDIPLTAAQVIVGIPARILQIRLNTANNRQALINANFELLKVLNQTKEEVNSQEGKSAKSSVQPVAVLPATAVQPRATIGTATTAQSIPDGTGGTNLATCVATCTPSQGGDAAAEARCRSYCTCQQNFCSGANDGPACRNYCTGQSVASQ